LILAMIIYVGCKLFKEMLTSIHKIKFKAKIRKL